jgi:hypothetical protein
MFAEMDYDKDGDPILPQLSDIIKTFEDKREQQLTQIPFHTGFDQFHGGVQYDNSASTPAHITAVPPNQNQDPFHPGVPRNDNDVTGGDVEHHGNNAVPGIDTPNAVPGGDSAVAANGRPRRNIGSYKDGPAKICRLPIDGKSYELAYPTEAPFSCLYPVLAISKKAGRPSNYHPNEKMQK